MLYDSMIAMEVSRIVHQERLLEAQNYRLLRALESANQLEMKASPWRRMRKAMNRVMSLLF